jgi:hypothetical protein
MRKQPPPLTPAVLRGLDGVRLLAGADVDDMETDEEWSHPWSLEDLRAGLDYLSRLIRWQAETKND